VEADRHVNQQSAPRHLLLVGLCPRQQSKRIRERLDNIARRDPRQIWAAMLGRHVTLFGPKHHATVIDVSVSTIAVLPCLRTKPETNPNKKEKFDMM